MGTLNFHNGDPILSETGTQWGPDLHKQKWGPKNRNQKSEKVLMGIRVPKWRPMWQQCNICLNCLHPLPAWASTEVTYEFIDENK